MYSVLGLVILGFNCRCGCTRANKIYQYSEQTAPTHIKSHFERFENFIICSWKAITQRRLRRASCVTGKAPIHTKTNQLMHKEHSFQFRANMNKTNNNNNYENTWIIYTHEISCLSGASFEPLQTIYTFNMHFEHTKYYNSFCACFLCIFIGGKCRITCA